MTTHDNGMPGTPIPGPDTTPGPALTHAGHDKAAVIVWRITADAADDPDTAAPADSGDSPLTPRLARHLVAIYSDVHGTVIDFDADIHLRHAAEATGRTYVTITNATDPGDRLTAKATLILLRWPRPDTEGTEPDAHSLLSRCQQHLADDGSTIVIVTAAPPGADGTSYRTYEQILLQAAQTAGLSHLHDIVPIDAADGRDAFTYATNQHTAPGATRHDTITTLVIFGHPGRRP
jgi:hypothetical protein